MTAISNIGVYKRRNPKATALYQLLNHHFDAFHSSYDSMFQTQYGFYRPIITHVVQKYLECGDLHQGFARIQCPDCHHEYLLSFSCRGRWFCPSCHNKKVVQFGHHLKETVLYPVPHRQYVFSIPKILRKYFLYNRKLLGKLSQCAARSLAQFFKVVLGKKHGITGCVVAIQTFGDYGRWHPHLHALVADGLFLESGYFYVMPNVSLRPLRELFRTYVLKMLKKEGLIDDSFIRMLLGWKHVSGFNIHNEVRIKPHDEKGLENLSQYIIRNTFSLEKMQYLHNTGKVLYRSKMSHGRNKRNFQVFPALDFIAAITQHIPERSFQLVRYYGWYSNRMRGDRKKQEEREAEQTDINAETNYVIEIKNIKKRKIPPLMWRECIKKIWEVDPLTCPKCAGEMRIISFIYQRKVIQKILTHLDIYENPPKQRGPPKSVVVEPELVQCKETVAFDDGWPGYEEPV